MRENYASVEEMAKEIWGEKTRVMNSVRVPGGDINSAYKVHLSSGDQIFVKTNSIDNANFFLTESRGLKALRSVHKIGVPKILGMGIDREKEYSFLALEYIESRHRINSYWETFGHELAQMHKAQCLNFVSQSGAEKDQEAGDSRYGFMEDNYIGAGPQKNTPMKSWVDFYRECRLMPQFERAQRYLDPDARKKADQLLGHLDLYLREPEFPSLLHGDLWSGNMLCGPDGKAWIIDPAVYVGDYEADLAMTQLFGSLPERFYDAYSEVNPIDRKGYLRRKKLYDLYHLLNHLNLFGSMYLRSVLEILNAY